MKRRDVWFLLRRLRQWSGGAQRVERFRGVRDELGKILSAQGKGTWVMRVGDQTSGSAHHLTLPHPSQGSKYLTWWWPRGPSSLPWPGWSPVAPARPVLRRVSPPFEQAPGLMLSSTGYLGLDEPRKGWRAILPPGFCALLLGGRRQKEFHQSVAQLCDRGSVTSSLWASASSLMNRPDWHLFLEVCQRDESIQPGAGP